MNIVEFLSLAFGAVAIAFGIRQYAITWPLNILSNALSITLFWQAARYADVGFRILFIFLALYGWYLWTRSKQSAGMQISPLSLQTGLMISALSLVGITTVWIFLKTGAYQGNVFEVSALVFTLTGQYLFARKHIESWYVFLVSDALSIGVYYVWHLYFLVFLAVLTAGMCVIGIWQWRKAMVQRQLKTGIISSS
jgi:nicotinamide mononucleotide transporter